MKRPIDHGPALSTRSHIVYFRIVPTFPALIALWINHVVAQSFPGGCNLTLPAIDTFAVPFIPSVRDMMAFSMKLQTDFYASMRSYLKDTLGVRVPIVVTNWDLGTPDPAGGEQPGRR